MQLNDLIELQAQCLPRAKPDVKVPAEGEVVNVTVCETITFILPSKAISPFFLSSSRHPHHFLSASSTVTLHRVHIDTLVHRVIVMTDVILHV
jgi:hypothetical protein